MCNKLVGFIACIVLFFFFFTPNIFASVVINEFQIEPAGDDQWVELFNTGPSEEDISGWVIDDEGGTEKYTIPSDIALPAGSCISFQSGKFNWNTTTQDKVRLLSGMNVVDEYSFPKSPGNTIVFLRLPDGMGAFATSSSATRDKLNSSGLLCYVPPTSSPTNTVTSSPNPTSTPSHTPTKTPTPTLKKTPTPSLSPKISKTPTTEDEEETLGASEVAALLPTPLPLEKSNLEKAMPIVISLLFIAIGLGILSVVLIWKKKEEKQ